MNFSCIANADQLCALLQNTPSVWWNRENIKSLLLFHMPFHVAASQESSNASATLEDMCCEASDTQDICSTTAVYSRPIFEYFPYPLLQAFLISIHVDTLLDYFTSCVKPTALGNSIEEICWTPPLPFCPNTGTSNAHIVQDAINQVKNHIQYIDHMHTKTSMIFSTVSNSILIIHITLQRLKSVTMNEDFQHQIYIRPFTSERRVNMKISAVILFLAVISLSLLVLKVLPLMKKNHHIFHPVNPKTKSLLFSAMLQCWLWFVILYVFQFLALSISQHLINTKSTVISTVYSISIDIGYYVFGIMGVFYLVEFPFLLWYISTKVMTMDRRGLNRRQCMLYMLKSVGCAGMVLFMQVLPVYLVFQMVFLITFPLFVLHRICTMLVLFSFFITCTALLFLPCITRCKHCLPYCCSIISVILGTFVCGVFLFVMRKEFQADTFSTLYDLPHIFTVLFTSGLLALLAFIIKRVFTYPKVEESPRDNCRDEDYKHLLDAA